MEWRFFNRFLQTSWVFYRKVILIINDTHTCSKWPEAFIMDKMDSHSTLQDFENVFLDIGWPIMDSSLFLNIFRNSHIITGFSTCHVLQIILLLNIQVWRRHWKIIIKKTKFWDFDAKVLIPVSRFSPYQYRCDSFRCGFQKQS